MISNSTHFHFVPSNPWVAVNWRTRGDIELELAPILERRKINFIPVGARRLHPDQNRVELDDGRFVDYDFLVIATGPKLAFEEIEGFGPAAHTSSICHVNHAVKAKEAWDAFVGNPGPIVVGAAQGASCFGPAYEFAAIMDTDLRRRKIRDKVPITFITAEPYIGHLGLGGVGDSKGLLESAFRDRHIRWICNAKITKVEADKVHVLELNEEGQEKKAHELPFRYAINQHTGSKFNRHEQGVFNSAFLQAVRVSCRFPLDMVQQLHYHSSMPVMHKFSASRVVMYAGDHLLAHVHVQIRDGRECTVELDSLTIVGRIAAREIREELLWIESNRAWLHEEWRRLNP